MSFSNKRAGCSCCSMSAEGDRVLFYTENDRVRREAEEKFSLHGGEYIRDGRVFALHFSVSLEIAARLAEIACSANYKPISYKADILSGIAERHRGRHGSPGTAGEAIQGRARQKACCLCGENFEPGSNRQKYCGKCRPRARQMANQV